MRYDSAAENDEPRWHRWWRMLLIGLCALILCSCRGPIKTRYDASALDSPMFSTLPQEAYTGAAAGYMPDDFAIGPPGMEQGDPMPYAAVGPWSPPGISQPWPEDEYLRDGGDRGLPAEVGDQWEVLGLELEDTIAHYDTLAGRTVVEASNRVHIYSPRFGAVRQVVSLVANEQANRAADVHLPTGPAGPTTVQLVTSSTQNVQANRRIGTRSTVTNRTRWGDGMLSGATIPKAFQDALLPYENLKLIRQGTIDSAEMAHLARGVDAANAWSHKQAVQVILDQKNAMVEVSDQSLLSVFTAKEPPGKPRLQVAKVASTPFAEPGDEVAFTIRFDNVGNQVIGNVTIIDNLTTRLECIPDTAQCSLDAEFTTQPNDGDSLALRCEIANPIQPGEGGIIRFRCRVR